DVDAELHVGDVVTAEQALALLAQLLGEFLVGEAVDRLAAGDLGLDELVEDPSVVALAILGHVSEADRVGAVAERDRGAAAVVVEGRGRGGGLSRTLGGGVALDRPVAVAAVGSAQLDRLVVVARRGLARAQLRVAAGSSARATGAASGSQAPGAASSARDLGDLGVRVHQLVLPRDPQGLHRGRGRAGQPTELAAVGVVVELVLAGL